MLGTVTLFSKRAYGFICGDDQMSYFVHISQTGGRFLKSNDRVQFDVGVDPCNLKTPEARNVVLIDNTSNRSEKDESHDTTTIPAAD